MLPTVRKFDPKRYDFAPGVCNKAIVGKLHGGLRMVGIYLSGGRYEQEAAEKRIGELEAINKASALVGARQVVVAESYADQAGGGCATELC